MSTPTATSAPLPATDELFGARLVLGGYLTVDDLVRCLSTQRQRGGSRALPLRQIVVDEALITEAEIEELLGLRPGPRRALETSAEDSVEESAEGSVEESGELGDSFEDSRDDPERTNVGPPPTGFRVVTQQEGVPPLGGRGGTESPTAVTDGPPPASSDELLDPSETEDAEDFDGAIEDDKLPTGARIDRYVVLTMLGRGGTGTVYRCFDPTLKRTVAVKLIRVRGTGEQERRRFLREASATARLSHPTIVAVHEVGDFEGRPFLVMEYVEGLTFDAVLRRERPDAIRAAEILRDVALALDYAHGRGVVHRDVKPQNIIIDNEGRPHLVDFGLARLYTAAMEKITYTGQFIGTPYFMSPEQARARGGIGPASDVYSLGAVLYFALCGRYPFEGEGVLEVCTKIVRDEPRPLLEVDPEQPEELAAVVMRCIRRDPAERYPSAAALADDLRRFILQGLGSSEEARPGSDSDLDDGPFRRDSGRQRVTRPADAPAPGAGLAAAGPASPPAPAPPPAAVAAPASEPGDLATATATAPARSPVAFTPAVGRDAPDVPDSIGLDEPPEWPPRESGVLARIAVPVVAVLLFLSVVATAAAVAMQMREPPPSVAVPAPAPPPAAPTQPTAPADWLYELIEPRSIVPGGFEDLDAWERRELTVNEPAALRVKLAGPGRRGLMALRLDLDGLRRSDGPAVVAPVSVEPATRYHVSLQVRSAGLEAASAEGGLSVALVGVGEQATAGWEAELGSVPPAGEAWTPLHALVATGEDTRRVAVRLRFEGLVDPAHGTVWIDDLLLVPAGDDGESGD